MSRGWRRAARLGAGIVGGIVGLAVLLLLVANVVSLVRQHRRYDIPDTALTVPADSASISRGRHLVIAVTACTSCHGADLGGQVVMDEPLLGRFVGSNLTAGAGGLGRQNIDRDLVRAIRHGVGRSDRSLVFMPSESFQELSDRDLGAIVAYLRTVPPVDRSLTPTRVGPMGRALHLVGFPLLPAEVIDHQRRVAEPPARAGVDYGSYLATLAGCRGCPGPELRGGGGPGPSLTSGALAGWTEADFGRAVREGRRPDGSALAEPMPWRNYAGMTDDEMSALWQYVRSRLQVSAPK